MTDNELCECYVYYNIIYNIILLYSRTRPNSSLTFDNRSRIVLDAYAAIMILYNMRRPNILIIIYCKVSKFRWFFFHQFPYNIVTVNIKIIIRPWRLRRFRRGVGGGVRRRSNTQEFDYLPTPETTEIAPRIG